MYLSLITNLLSVWFNGIVCRSTGAVVADMPTDQITNTGSRLSGLRDRRAAVAPGRSAALTRAHMNSYEDARAFGNLRTVAVVVQIS